MNSQIAYTWSGLYLALIERPDGSIERESFDTLEEAQNYIQEKERA